MVKEKLFIVFCLVCSQACSAYCQVSPDDIVGTWLTEDKTGEITIFRDGSRYFGRITGGTGDEEYDVHNPDEERRNDPLIGLVIMKALRFKGDGWEGGTIYDARSGKTYNCNIALPGKDKLRITGYIGLSWIGRSEVWERLY